MKVRIPGRIVSAWKNALPSRKGSLPSSECSLRSGRSPLLSQKVSIPPENDSFPSGREFLLSIKDSLPSSEASPRSRRSSLPSINLSLPPDKIFPPGGRGFIPGQEGFIRGWKCLLPALLITAAAGLGLLWGVQPSTPGRPPGAAPIVSDDDSGEIARALRRWYAEGTAAGNRGDYYDNRDRGHSRLDLARYPQLTAVTYTEAERKRNADYALQSRILPQVVIGNSSTSAAPEAGGSLPRHYYAQPRGLEFLFAQYSRNNLYVYPEHRDHDPGHNGPGGDGPDGRARTGYGDLFPTNTPYLIISQGSSGSDQPFLRAIASTLAAFRPEVKRKLIDAGMLMPTVQMLLRTTSKRLQASGDYLTGRAHPTVFRGSDLDPRAMVEAAHRITLSSLPPIALIRVEREERARSGIDYFEPGRTEVLGDTPAVIARVFRGSARERRIIVSAAESRDLNGKPLRFFWSVLRGDPAAIGIRYLNEERSRAEITVPFHDRFALPFDPELETNRVDIGVFVHNGDWYSPPAFVTFTMLDNEARTYLGDGRLVDIGYGAGSTRLSVADWEKFLAVLEARDSLPARLLEGHLGAAADRLRSLAPEYRAARAAVLRATERKSAIEAAGKGGGKTDRKALAAAREELAKAQKTERAILERRERDLPAGAAAAAAQALHRLVGDPDLYSGNTVAFARLEAAAGKEAQAALAEVREALVRSGLAEESAGRFRLTRLRKQGREEAELHTRFGLSMIERLNAALLGHLLFPGVVKAEWRPNYVDPRIASSTDWRDVYLYAPDGSRAGWRRFSPDGIREFHADGWLVRERDGQGRCIRAQAVRYEVKNQGKAGRTIRMVPTSEFRTYSYKSPDDWKGSAKK